MNGILVLDKPSGMTSRDALDRAMGWFPKRTKLGHAGTLDPLATGVLVVCIGHATRLIEYVQNMGKEYRTTIGLGATSDTDDADGTITPYPDARPVSRAEIVEMLPHFLGAIEQVPPVYSAARVEGRRAYALARKGREVDLAPRTVRVDRLELIRFDDAELELEIECGKGTYIRSIARDLGERLGVGGYVKTLRRTRIGKFLAVDAVDLDATRDEAIARLHPMSEALSDFASITVDDAGWERLRHGNPAPLVEELASTEAAVFHAGKFVAVARVDREMRCLHPTKVFEGG